jgi:hypothetical protein
VTRYPYSLTRGKRDLLDDNLGKAAGARALS